MPAVVDGPRQQRFEEDTPKTLHGMIPVKTYMCQCVDPQGYRRMIMVVRVPAEPRDKLFTYPQGFWDEMGSLPEWLAPQVEKLLYPEKMVEEKKISRKRSTTKTEQLENDQVDVGGDQ